LMKYLCDKITNDMEKVDTVIKSINWHCRNDVIEFWWDNLSYYKKRG
jgi:hypothetical protein